MSTEAVGWVLRGGPDQKAIVIPSSLSRHVGASAIRMVLVVLAEHANRSGLAWPGQRTIADEAGLYRRDVDHALRQLVELGLISVHAEAVPRKRGRTYRLAFVADHSSRDPKEVARNSAGDSAGIVAGDSAGIPQPEPEPEPEPPPSPPIAAITSDEIVEAAIGIEIRRAKSNGRVILNPAGYERSIRDRLVREEAATIQRLMRRADRCVRAGQALSVEAFALAVLGEHQRLADANPDPADCATRGCSTCDGTRFVQAADRSGVVPCPERTARLGG